ncbi:MAG: hypothetical protein ABJN38_11845 [Lentilitoribacter sp.]
MPQGARVSAGPDWVEREAALVADTSMPRFEESQEVAVIAVMLGSDDAAYMTRAELTVDGGMDRSEGMLMRNCSTQKADMDRFICVNGVAALESQASYPFVTSELAKINEARMLQ